MAGKIVLDSGGVIDCTIRDRSASGARLKVVSVVGIPDRFVLSIGAGTERYIAVVEWRKQGELGVQLTSGPCQAPAHIP